jgi:hypothetical protein
MIQVDSQTCQTPLPSECHSNTGLSRTAQRLCWRPVDTITIRIDGNNLGMSRHISPDISGSRTNMWPKIFYQDDQRCWNPFRYVTRVVDVARGQDMNLERWQLRNTKLRTPICTYLRSCPRFWLKCVLRPRLRGASKLNNIPARLAEIPALHQMQRSTLII